MICELEGVIVSSNIIDPHWLFLSQGSDVYKNMLNICGSMKRNAGFHELTSNNHSSNQFCSNVRKTVHMKGIVSLLIEKGADINITDSKYGKTPFTD
jgi:hypothetical protein